MIRLDMKSISISILALLLLVATGSGQTHDLGTVTFPTSGSPEAQNHFLQGVLFLHSFEYDDARDAFLAAQEAEPGFAMAYWGEAMSFNHPIWMRQYTGAGKDVLLKLAKTRAGRQALAPTDREKDYLKAVEILYGDGDKKSRDFSYAEEMKRLSDKYPDDPEAASFYALALLGTCHDGRDFRTYMKAAAVVEEVFNENPNHPGAAHYLIHSYDDPIHAPLGLRAARVYAKIAPSASHALHMPSHIFVAMGMWDDVVSSNIDSWEAAEERVKRKNLTNEDRGYHALWWLEYGYLQQGRYSDAREMLSIIEQDYEKSRSNRTRYHLAVMRAAYLIETHRWDGEASRIRLDPDEMNLRLASVDHFAVGFSAARSGNLDLAKQSLVSITEKRKSGEMGSPADAQAAEIMQLELAATIAFSEGQTQSALQTMSDAAEIEDRLSFQFGPPIPVKPVRELYGEFLLQLKQYDKAREQFSLALERAPGRVLSLIGMARSEAGQGNLEEARKYYQDLERIWHQADQKLPTIKDMTMRQR